MKVQNYLSNLGSSDTSDRFLDEFVKDLSKVVQSRLKPSSYDRKFRIRMSNLGRPGCTLQAQQHGLRREPAPYSNEFRSLYGDLVESAAKALMRNAGVQILAEQAACSLNIAGEKIDGTADIVIGEEGPKVYDVKSASSFAFNNKYSGKNLKNLWDEGDNYGYVTQIYLYSEALQIPVGGLIVINKENGEWGIVPPSITDEEMRVGALKRAEDNVRRIINKEPFSRDFSDVAETFRGKPTGNRILPLACSFCDFKEACWPQVEHRPSLVSKGASPKWYYYTKIVDKKDDAV